MKWKKSVSSELGVRMSKAFADFDVKPMAAASLGQVHRAVLRDGRQVAVKVQRPGIRDAMVEDLEALEEIADFLDEHTEVGKRYEFRQMLEQFRKSLLRELDYRQEANNLLRLCADRSARTSSASSFRRRSSITALRASSRWSTCTGKKSPT